MGFKTLYLTETKKNWARFLKVKIGEIKVIALLFFDFFCFESQSDVIEAGSQRLIGMIN